MKVQITTVKTKIPKSETLDIVSNIYPQISNPNIRKKVVAQPPKKKCGPFMAMVVFAPCVVPAKALLACPSKLRQRSHDNALPVPP